MRQIVRAERLAQIQTDYFRAERRVESAILDVLGLVNGVARFMDLRCVH